MSERIFDEGRWIYPPGLHSFDLGDDQGRPKPTSTRAKEIAEMLSEAKVTPDIIKQAHSGALGDLMPGLRDLDEPDPIIVQDLAAQLRTDRIRD